jgi:hypothetical protein
MTKLRDKLLGSWRLVESEGRDASGEANAPLGEDPIGLLTYDASGTVSAQLMRRNQPRFRSDDWQRATAKEKSAAWSGYFGYFGVFAVDERAKTVIHYVEGSWFPNLVGTQQIRYWSFKGRRLVLSAHTPWGDVTLVWERFRPVAARTSKK